MRIFSFAKDKMNGGARRGEAKRFGKIFASLRSPFETRGGSGKALRGALPALFVGGLLAALCLCLMLKGALLGASLDAQRSAAMRAALRAPSFANAGSAGELGDFTRANPFGAEARGAEKAPSRSPLSAFTLHGTLPNVGAWISGPEGMRLYLKGQSVGGYKLVNIKYGEALLDDGRETHPLFLLLSGGAAVKSPPPLPPAAAQSAARAPAKPKLDFSGVEPASADREGAVPRELVDALLMNPYDEIGKMRMVPAENGEGMLLQRIDGDSVFAHVGVLQGDVIQAVNGVKITNMGDAANAVNSLMAGSRFDVSVMRGGKPLELKYQVR